MARGERIVDMVRGVMRAIAEAWRLAKPYFQTPEKWVAFELLAAVMVLNLITVYGQVLNTYWFKYAYNALQRRDADVFWALAVTYQRVPMFPYLIPGFLWIGMILTVSSTYAVYLHQMLQIRWWRWLTESFVDDWMAGRVYYQLALKGQTGTSIDNPDQRIADDLNTFVAGNLMLAISFVSNIVSIVSYVGILWMASEPMRIFGIHVPGYLVWAALLYSSVGTLIAHLIGRKLIDLNFLQQRYQADMRFNLVRIRENREQIALYGGEREEASGVMRRFEAIRLNWWQIMRRTKAFNFFALGFTNFAIFVSLIVGAPDYFAGIISLGVLMLINSSFNNVQTAFSWFVSSYPQIITWRATVQRIDGFARALHEAGPYGAHSGITTDAQGEELLAENLEIHLPDGQPLFTQNRLTLGRGGPLAITGLRESANRLCSARLQGSGHSAAAESAARLGDLCSYRRNRISRSARSSRR
jgi:vitamin B12/bleomycin/antimicrobial peptide transport system ATP-binding/permease protein